MTIRLAVANTAAMVFANTLGYLAANAAVPDADHPSWLECQIVVLVVGWGAIGLGSWISRELDRV